MGIRELLTGLGYKRKDLSVALGVSNVSDIEHFVAREDELLRINQTLRGDGNIESKNTSGQTPLWWAARNSNLHMVKMLLEAGANIESADTSGQTPLWWAARNSNSHMVKMLLEAGANIESKNTNDQIQSLTKSASLKLTVKVSAPLR